MKLLKKKSKPVRLFKGNCFEVMKSLPDCSVELVLTDPPYFNSDKTRADWDKNFSFEAFWEEVSRVLKPNGAVVMFGNEPFSSIARLSNQSWYKYDIKWVKNRATGFANANYRPMNKYEDIMVFSPANASAGGKNNPMTYNPQGLIPVNKVKKNSANRQGSIGERTNNLGKNNSLLAEGSSYTQKYTNYPPNVVEFQCDTTHYHPTQKPEALLEYLVLTYSNEGDTVLDCFMGSGSTGVACIHTNRKFIGIELDDKYFEVAEQRCREVP